MTTKTRTCACCSQPVNIKYHWCYDCMLAKGIFQKGNPRKAQKAADKIWAMNKKLHANNL